MTIHQMDILDATGHTSITWDPADADTVTTARDHYDAMIAKGYRAFRITGNDNQGERLNAFDPSAAKIMFVPQRVGG